MIRIGLDDSEKKLLVSKYINDFGIKTAYVFAPAKFPLTVYTDISVEYIEYTEIIEYATFYPLLEKIDDSSLLVFNECMRTQNRSDLTYNCAHHYCNQTGHKIVFEHFPFIEDSSDFMILLDFINKGQYKGKAFSDEFLADEDVAARRHNITLTVIDIETAGDLFGQSRIYQEYEKKKKYLFDNLGMSDPDTIPRNLHVFVGNFKEGSINPHLTYIARNSRFKLPNIITYKDAIKGEYIVIDFPHRRLDFNDFLKVSGILDVKFISSEMKVDLYYISEMEKWIERLGEFYAKTAVY